jgi:membrane associated rhomboid family serine protease
MMEVPMKQVISAAVFAVLWTAFMVSWSGIYSAGNIAILGTIGAAIGALFAWIVERRQRSEHKPCP